MNDYTTCCSDELPYKFREPFDFNEGRRSSRIVGKIVGYALVAVVGTAVSCVCWWFAHR